MQSFYFSPDEIGEDGGRVWLVQRSYAPDAVTANAWLRSGELKKKGTQKAFKINTSWYGITIYETTLGDKGASGAKPAAASSGALTVTVSGLRNDNGNVLIGVFQYSAKNNIAQTTAVVEGGKAEAVFAGLAFGEYAVVVFHDENGNQQVDMTDDVPNEGLGYSNALSAPQGPPDYEYSRFMFDANNTNVSVLVFYYDAP